VTGADSAFNEQTHAEGRVLLRVSTELRRFLAEAPADDAEAQSLLRDCDVLDRVGNWLSSTNAVTFGDGLSVR
jgi:hypothetical protein